MPYGIIKVDTVTFTNDGVDKSVTLSGLVQNPTFSGNVTVTGTLSGVTVTGTTANFTSGNFTNISGGTHTITSGVFAAGSAASPSITFTGDLNTGIYSPGADQVAISTGGSGRLFVDASGRVGVGTSPSYALHVSGTGTVSSRTLATDATGDASFFVQNDGNGICGPLVYGSTKTAYGALASNETAFYSNRSTTIMADGGSAVIKFATGGNTERARIDSSGRLLVGTSSASGSGGAKLEVAKQTMTTSDMGLASFQLASASSRWPQVFLEKSRGAAVGQKTLVVDGDSLGELAFRGADGTNYLTGANIVATVDGVASTNDLPTRLVFSTTADGAASPTERMRITQAGHVFVGNTTGDYNTVGVSLFSDGYLQAVTSGRSTLALNRKGSDGVIVDFYRDTNNPGTISVTTTATSYNTSSDYRLKENVTPVTDGITRLQQLKPSRFNFIAAPGCTVDGFIAHEVQSVVPEAITGEKDAVDADGKPQYQGIDQSKLVPLLTAALQEAVAKIESLESRLTAAGI